MSATGRRKLRLRREARRWKWANVFALVRAVLYGRALDPNEPLRKAAGKAGW